MEKRIAVGHLTSSAFGAHGEIRPRPAAPGCSLKVILALLGWNQGFEPWSYSQHQQLFLAMCQGQGMHCAVAQDTANIASYVM